MKKHIILESAHLNGDVHASKQIFNPDFLAVDAQAALKRGHPSVLWHTQRVESAAWLMEGRTLGQPAPSRQARQAQTTKLEPCSAIVRGDSSHAKPCWGQCHDPLDIYYVGSQQRFYHTCNQWTRMGRVKINSNSIYGGKVQTDNGIYSFFSFMIIGVPSNTDTDINWRMSHFCFGWERSNISRSKGSIWPGFTSMNSCKHSMVFKLIISPVKNIFRY